MYACPTVAVGLYGMVRGVPPRRNVGTTFPTNRFQRFLQKTAAMIWAPSERELSSVSETEGVNSTQNNSLRHASRATFLACRFGRCFRLRRRSPPETRTLNEGGHYCVADGLYGMVRGVPPLRNVGTTFPTKNRFILYFSFLFIIIAKENHMNYEESVAYIHSLEAFGIRPGLERIAALCHALCDPQKSLKFVHVAGTNGKGSTSTMIAAALQAAGYTVGLFTSPYVIDFRERIRVNGEMIPPEHLAVCMTAVRLEIERLAAQGMQVTEFEAVTALAFLYFALAKCRVVVLEVGLGGRFDATNVIDKPLVSVITSISLDHTAVLGDTIEQIAAEKCGIIKPGGVTVCYPKQPPAALDVIRKTCEERGNVMILPPIEFLNIERADLSGSAFRYRDLEIRLPLPGEHMIYNCVTAIDALYNLRIFGICAFDDAIRKGIASVAMPARTEVIRRDPLILLDGGHNEDCANALAATLRTQLAGRRIVAVVSLMADKDYDAYLQRVLPFVAQVIATQAPVPRALDAQALAAAAAPYCPQCSAVADPLAAVQAGFRALEGDNDVLLVCGSFYLAGAVREELKNLQTR